MLLSGNSFSADLVSHCIPNIFLPYVMSIRTLLEADAQNASSRNMEDPPEFE